MTKKNLKFILTILYVLVMTVIAWYYNCKSLIGIDDANIGFVYMRNVALGHGFVYNVGSERVEGFTSLFYILTGSLIFSISKHPEILLLIFNACIVSFALWKLICFIDDYFNDHRLITPYSLLLLGLLASIPGYFDWTVLAIMETGLWGSLLTLITLNLFEFNPENKSKRNRVYFHILIVLIILCRPESILWCVFFILIRFYKHFISINSFGKSFLFILPSVVVVLITLISLIGWREYYFGYPLPNTYYAKISSDRLQNIKDGLQYLIDYFHNFPVALLCLPLFPLCFYKIAKSKSIEKNYPFLVSVGIVCISFLIPLITGGDHFKYSRFMQPTEPLLILSLFFSLHYLKFNFKYLSSLIFVLFASFIPKDNLYHNISTHVSPLSHEWQLAINGRNNAEMLNVFFDKLPEYPSQGVLCAGGNAFAYKGFTNDLLALNNVEMAHKDKIKSKNVIKNHASFNKDVFFKQKPDLFLYGNRFTKNTDFTNDLKLAIDVFEREVFKNVETDPRFNDNYTAVRIQKKDYDEDIIVFASNTFLKTLNPEYYKYEVIPYQ